MNHRNCRIARGLASFLNRKKKSVYSDILKIPFDLFSTEFRISFIFSKWENLSYQYDWGYRHRSPFQFQSNSQLVTDFSVTINSFSFVYRTPLFVYRGTRCIPLKRYGLEKIHVSLESASINKISTSDRKSYRDNEGEGKERNSGYIVRSQITITKSVVWFISLLLFASAPTFLLAVLVQLA